MEYLIVKWLHILSSTFLFGTGVGSAFYLFFISRTRDVRAVAMITRWLVIADWLFTATTMVAQPVTGFWLVYRTGYDLGAIWLRWSIILFVVAAACWLPVVWLQIRMRDLARDAAAADAPLPASYWRYFRIWTALGIPALIAFLVIFYLMVAKPF